MSLNEIPRGSQSGRAFVGTPVLDALERLLSGELRSGDDLALIELALRAVVLHRDVVSVEERYLAEHPGAPTVALVSPMESPALSFSGDDPRLPVTVRAELEAASRSIMDAARRERSKGRDVIVCVSPDISPAMVEALNAANARMQRALRLLLGYCGGAGLFLGGADDENPEPQRSLTGMLAALDAWYDPCQGSDPIAFDLPPLLAILMHRAPARTSMLKTILDLRAELHEAVDSFHDGLRDLASPHRATKVAAARYTDRQLERLRELCKLDSAPVLPTVLRGLAGLIGSGVPATSMIQSGPTIESVAALGVSAVPVIALGFGSVHINRSLTPSLADSLFRGARAVRGVCPTALLSRHLSDRELSACSGDRDTRPTNP